MSRDSAAIHRSIQELAPEAWNALGTIGNPFARHEFLAALEAEQCVGPGSGWEPRYVTVSDAQGLAGAAATFIKNHSYGEFVFDFAWARAYERIGRRYYPKLTPPPPSRRRPVRGADAAGPERRRGRRRGCCGNSRRSARGPALERARAVS
jgi:predicted N-acyltransferase